MDFYAELGRRGDNAVRFALRDARRAYQGKRLRGHDVSRWTMGSLFGQMLVAKFDMDADPLVVMAAENEIRFLLKDSK